MLIRNLVRGLCITAIAAAAVAFTNVPVATAGEMESSCAPESNRTCITQNGNEYSGKKCTGGSGCVSCFPESAWVCIGGDDLENYRTLETLE